MSFDFDNMTYEQAREVKENLGNLFDSPGWVFITEFLQEREELRNRELVQMCPENVEQMVRFARIKGGIEEMQLFPEMIAQVYSDVTTFVKNVQMEEDENDGA